MIHVWHRRKGAVKPLPFIRKLVETSVDAPDWLQNKCSPQETALELMTFFNSSFSTC